MSTSLRSPGRLWAQMREADLLISGGGSFLHEADFELLRPLVPLPRRASSGPSPTSSPSIFMARSAGLPVMWYAQGLGPLHTRSARRLVAAAGSLLPGGHLARPGLCPPGLRDGRAIPGAIGRARPGVCAQRPLPSRSGRAGFSSSTACTPGSPLPCRVSPAVAGTHRLPREPGRGSGDQVAAPGSGGRAGAPPRVPGPACVRDARGAARPRRPRPSPVPRCPRPRCLPPSWARPSWCVAMRLHGGILAATAGSSGGGPRLRPQDPSFRRSDRAASLGGGCRSARGNERAGASAGPWSEPDVGSTAEPSRPPAPDDPAGLTGAQALVAAVEDSLAHLDARRAALARAVAPLRDEAGRTARLAVQLASSGTVFSHGNDV